MENLISIVVPAHNEEKNLGEFIGQAAAAVKKITNDFEIIIVDDGSTDGSLAVLKQQKVKFTQLKIIRMRRRCGQTAAIMAGFELAKGKIVVVLDADLQQDPADIAKLIKPIIDDQAEVVSGRRQKRKHSIFIKLIASFERWFNRIFLGIKLYDTAVSPNAYKRIVLTDLNLYGEMHRFLVPILFWRGWRIVEVPVAHYPRKFGQSKYKATKAVGGFLDLLIVKFWQDFSSRPIRLFGTIGLWLMLIGGLIGLEEAARKLIFHLSIYNRTLPLLAAFLAIVGIQFLILGILADIMVRIYYQNKPEDLVEKIIE
ncbi:MAG: Glycosyl transferase, group 2 family protein [Microgenomates group bacterium GW2011_GWC2_45_8]|nr:MAG: Glycosyl transferase, group 2 family protein [Microgenomates group bacterium GW2011_GWC2_45_8]